MSEPTFTITLADLRAVSDAVCEVDGLRPHGDVRIAEKISAAHAALIRTLGDQVGLVYDLDPEPAEPQKVPA